MSPKKTLRLFMKDWMIFSKTVFNYKISCISTSLKKENLHSKSYSKKVTGSSISAELLLAVSDIVKNIWSINSTFLCKKLKIKMSEY